MMLNGTPVALDLASSDLTPGNFRPHLAEYEDFRVFMFLSVLNPVYARGSFDDMDPKRDISRLRVFLLVFDSVPKYLLGKYIIIYLRKSLLCLQDSLNPLWYI